MQSLIILKLRDQPGRSRAKGDLVISSTRAGEGAATVVIGVAISPGAAMLEELRVHRRPASRRRPILAGAAVLRPTERPASAPARHPAAASGHTQLRRAPAVHVRSATSGSAVASAGGGGDGHG